MHTYEFFYGELLLNIYKDIITSLHNYLGIILVKMPGSFIGLAEGLVWFYIIYVCIACYFSRIEKPKEAIVTVFWLLLLNEIIFDGPTYIEWVFNPFRDLVSNLAGFFVRVDAYDSFSGREIAGTEACFYQLGALLDKVFNFCFGKNLEFTVMQLWKFFQNSLAFGLLIGVVMCFALSYLVLIIIAKVMIYILFCVGPIFIFCFCFKGSRGYFKSWATALLNYGLIIIFASLIVGLMANTIDLAVTQLLSYGDQFDFFGLFFKAEYWKLFFMCLLGIGLLLKVPDIAASLSGGQAGSTAGITGALSAVGGAATGGATKALGMGGRMAGGAGRIGAGMGRNAYGRFAPPGVKNALGAAANFTTAGARRTAMLWR
jgi:type IV secretory pathway VirB6-like protein